MRSLWVSGVLAIAVAALAASAGLFLYLAHLGESQVRTLAYAIATMLLIAAGLFLLVSLLTLLLPFREGSTTTTDEK